MRRCKEWTLQSNSNPNNTIYEHLDSTHPPENWEYITVQKVTRAQPPRLKGGHGIIYFSLCFFLFCFQASAIGACLSLFSSPTLFPSIPQTSSLPNGPQQEVLSTVKLCLAFSNLSFFFCASLCTSPYSPYVPLFPGGGHILLFHCAVNLINGHSHSSRFPWCSVNINRILWEMLAHTRSSQLTLNTNTLWIGFILSCRRS